MLRNSSQKLLRKGVNVLEVSAVGLCAPNGGYSASEEVPTVPGRQQVEASPCFFAQQFPAGGSPISDLGFSAEAVKQQDGWRSSRRLFSAHAHEHVSSLPDKEHEKSCWSCDNMVKRGGLTCRGCEKIQPPDASLNLFELFGMFKPTYDVNPAALEQRYKQLQFRLHPDRFSQRPLQEREYSATQASMVNHAYSVLKAPLARANYLLSLAGHMSGDGFEGTVDDPALLMEVMEAREEVEETDDPHRLKQMLDTNRTSQAGLDAQLAAAFKRNDLQAAAQLAHKLTYLVKLEQEIVNKL